MRTTERRLDYFAVARSASTLATALFVLLAGSAFAHDYKRPNLDRFYESLMRPHANGFGGGTSCCSRFDCHTTDAELRDDGTGHYSWWARYGEAHDGPNGREWQLGDWVKVPDEIIVRGPTGNPVANEAGEAILCHTQANIQNKPAPAAASYFCFVPPNES